METAALAGCPNQSRVKTSRHRRRARHAGVTEEREVVVEDEAVAERGEVQRHGGERHDGERHAEACGGHRGRGSSPGRPHVKRAMGSELGLRAELEGATSGPAKLRGESGRAEGAAPSASADVTMTAGTRKQRRVHARGSSSRAPTGRRTMAWKGGRCVSLRDEDGRRRPSPPFGAQSRLSLRDRSRSETPPENSDGAPRAAPPCDRGAV